MKMDLLVIDPQNDFCDKSGALSVPGASDDMKRLSSLVTKFKDKWHQIHVTMDSHHYVDVGHPIFIIDKDGNHPTPITVVTKDDIDNGVWKASNPNYQQYLKEYVKSLKDNSRYDYTIWPFHCVIGSWGFSIYPKLFDSLIEYEKRFKFVNKVTKGSNPLTEHYSAIQADVPDPKDPTTSLNTRLIDTLKEVDTVLLAGEALSHCLAETVRDIADNFGEDNIKKLILLKDATSPVPGFENYADNFISDMTSRGMQISETKDFI